MSVQQGTKAPRCVAPDAQPPSLSLPEATARARGLHAAFLPKEVSHPLAEVLGASPCPDRPPLCRSAPRSSGRRMPPKSPSRLRPKQSSSRSHGCCRGMCRSSWRAATTRTSWAPSCTRQVGLTVARGGRGSRRAVGTVGHHLLEMLKVAARSRCLRWGFRAAGSRGLFTGGCGRPWSI